MSAYTYLHALQTEIGARLPGSENEARTLAWLEEKLQAFGLTPERETFIYQPSPVLSWISGLILGLGVLAFTLLSTALHPLLIIAGVVALIALDGDLTPRLRRKLGRATGYNIIAGITRPWAEIQNATERKPLALVCAHYDTAPALPSWQQKLFQYEETVYGMGLLGVILLIAYCGVSSLLWLFGLFGLETAFQITLTNMWRLYGIWLVVALGLPGIIFFVLGLTPHVFKTARPENPGADDNGSGVAAALAIVENLASRAITDWDLVVAFWGAEEVGLVGSRRFVEKHKARLDPRNTIIINLDGVGRGKCLGAVVGQGIVWRKAVDESLVSLWEQACNNFGAKTIRFWMTTLSGATDQAAWLAANFTKTISIGCGDPAPMSPLLLLLYALFNLPGSRQYFRYDHIHSPVDSLDDIRPESLEMTTRAVTAFIQKLALETDAHEIPAP